MAVFPDYISLKNSTDTDDFIIQEIEAGGTDEINQGEVVIGLRTGYVTMFTKDAVGDIVKLQGAVQSVNGLDEVVSLGIQNMNDYAPQIGDGPVYVYRTTSNSTPPSGVINIYSSSTYENFAANLVDDNGVDWETQWYDEDLTKGVVGQEWGNVVDVYVNSSLVVRTVFRDVGNRSSGRVTFIFREEAWISNLVDGDIIQLNIQGWSAVPLAADDLLQYDDVFEKFIPVPASSVSTGGGGGTGVVYWGGGDFTTGTSDGQPADGGVFT